ARERVQARQLLPLPREDALSAEPVDRPVPRGRDDPRARAGGDAVPGPSLERDGEGLLDGVLGQVEVAKRVRESGDRTSPLLAEDAGDRLRHAGALAGIGITGRTSIVP